MTQYTERSSLGVSPMASYLNHARKTFADVISDVQDQGSPHYVKNARPVRVAVVGTCSLLRTIIWPTRTDTSRNLHHSTVMDGVGLESI